MEDLSWSKSAGSIIAGAIFLVVFGVDLVGRGRRFATGNADVNEISVLAGRIMNALRMDRFTTDSYRFSQRTIRQ